jgi:hypothetical protein
MTPPQTGFKTVFERDLKAKIARRLPRSLWGLSALWRVLNRHQTCTRGFDDATQHQNEAF